MRPLAIALSSLIVAAVVAAQAPPASVPNFTGFWELRFDSKSVPVPTLTREAAAATTEIRRHDANATRWCHMVGLPALMDNWGPIDIVQNRVEMAILTDLIPSVARHIYFNQSHPDMNIFDPTPNGHSIGRWEGETLVVDTIGFSERGLIAIPGGGRRTTKSRLTERFRFLQGGNRLSVVSTWEDATTFAKPHSYEFIYVKAPKGTTLREAYCPTDDEEHAKFLLRPFAK